MSRLVFSAVLLLVGLIYARAQSDFLTALSNAGIQGSIQTEGELDYDVDIVPWNLRVQPKPLALVYADDPQDVSLAVKVAAQYGVPVQPRSGGHSFASYSLGGTDGALVIDLAAMDQVVVNQTTWNATIGGGTRLQGISDGLYSQGQRTIAHGTCPQVGMGGHATIGGIGPLSRMYGLTLDQVVDTEVVLANGTITHANALENPDLFWALRGAGASFGIITSFTVETHPAPTAVTHYSFQLTIGSPSELATAFSNWQSFISSPTVLADRSFNSVVIVTTGTVLVQGSRLGTQAELQASAVYIELLQYFPVSIQSEELDWLASVLAWATDGIYDLSGAISIAAYMKSFTVRQSKLLTNDTLTELFDYMGSNAPLDAVYVLVADLEAGRISDFSNSDTAYAQRDALYTVALYTVALPGLPFPQDAIAFLNGTVATINNAMPDGDFGAYPGYVDPLIPANEWPTEYWGANYARLLQVKQEYDPGHVFANPQSVGS